MYHSRFANCEFGGHGRSDRRHDPRTRLELRQRVLSPPIVPNALPPLRDLAHRPDPHLDVHLGVVAEHGAHRRSIVDGPRLRGKLAGAARCDPLTEAPRVPDACTPNARLIRPASSRPTRLTWDLCGHGPMHYEPHRQPHAASLRSASFARHAPKECTNASLSGVATGFTANSSA